LEKNLFRRVGYFHEVVRNLGPRKKSESEPSEGSLEGDRFDDGNFVHDYAKAIGSMPGTDDVPKHFFPDNPLTEDNPSQGYIDGPDSDVSSPRSEKYQVIQGLLKKLTLFNDEDEEEIEVEIV
jgi:hypothetical protein